MLMSTKIYSVLHGCVRSIALVALLCLPFLSVAAFAALSAPTGVAVTGLTPTSGTLQWEVALGARHDYDIIVSTSQLSSSVLGNATTPCTVTAATPGVVLFVSQAALANATTYALTGLTEGTHYYAYIRQNGDAQYEDHSPWVSYEFSTPCQATSVLPVLADFDGGNFLPSCWSSGAKVPTFSTSVKHGDSGNSMMLSATGDEGCYVYSPVFTGNAHAYYLTMNVYGAAGATYRIGVAAASDLLSIEPIAEATVAAANTWQSIDVAVPLELRAELEQVEYVWVIYNSAADGALPFYVDDVVIKELPTCIYPTDLHVTGLGATSVNLAWTERGTASAWVVEYMQGEETYTVNAASNPFVLSGLLPNTLYSVRVKSACSASDASEWTPYITVKTNCDAQELPYSENFDTYTEGNSSSSTRPDSPVYPECWSVLNEAGSTSAYPQAFLSSLSSYAVSGNSFFVKMSKSSALVAVLPAIDAPASTELEVDFTYRNEGVSESNGNVQLGYLTNAVDTASFVLIAEYDKVSTKTAVEERVVLPANAQIAFRFVGGTSNNYYAAIDNVVVRVAPTCAKPKSLVLAAAEENELTLAWRPGGNETSWELCYSINGGELQTVVVNDNPEYTITGLESNTRYTLSQLALRAICSAADSSEVVTFPNIIAKTACGLVSLPYSYGFEPTSFPGDCWTASYHLAGDLGGWSRSTSQHSEGNASAYLADTQDGNRNVIASPFFHSDAPNTLRVSFWMRRSSYPSTLTNEEGVRVWVNTIATDTLGGTPIIHVLREYSLGGTGIKVPAEAAAGWYNYTAEIPVAGDVCLLFEGISEYGSASYIDDVVIEPVPTCDRPSSIAASSYSANQILVDITDNNAQHTAWEVVAGVAGFNPDEATPIAVSENSAVITLPFNLVGMTTYEVYVRTVCSEDDKSYFRGPASFTYIDYSAVTDLPLHGVGDYPWTMVEDGGILKLQSTNQGRISTESDIEATVVVPEGAQAYVTFDYFGSGETSYDYLCIYVDEANPSTGNYVSDFADGGQAGTPNGTTGTYTVYFTEPGTHTIRWRFRKDISGDAGADMGQIWNIRFSSTSAWAPKNIVLRAVDITSAEIAWEQCADVLKNEVMIENQILETATNSIVLNDLTASTPYEVKVRSILANDTTEWSEPFTFRTDCGARTIPFAEGFELEGDELCWKAIGNAVEISTTTSAFDGNKALMVTNDSVAGLLVSPRLDAESLAEYEVSLAINLASVEYEGAIRPLTIGVMTDPNDVSTYIDLGDIVIPSARSWKEYRFSLADLATPDYADWADAKYVVVSMSDSATYYFDAITVAAAADCPKPTALDIQPDGEESVITWVSDAADHFAEVALGNNIVFAGNVQNPFIPTGLEANTLYSVRVRAICDADSSEWTPWTNFTTPCSYAAIPFVEGFEDYSESTFPDCWSKSVLSGPGTLGFTINTSDYSTYVHAGSHSLKLNDMQATTYSLAVLPMFNSEHEGGLTLSFWMYRTTGTSHPLEGVRVWVNNVPSLDGATPLMHVTRYGGIAADSLIVAPVTSAGWYQYEKVLPISGPTYVMFEGISEYGSATYIDDIEVKETPSCIKPSGLQLVAFDADSATVAWNAEGTESAWELVYKLNNSAADTVLVQDVPSFSIGNLLPGTSYTLNVLSLRAVCSSDDTSEPLAASFSFRTPCAVEFLPIEENFADGIDDCWTRYTGLLFTDGVSTSAADPASYGWNVPTTKVFTDGEVKVNVYGVSCQSWLVTPAFRVSDPLATLSFDVALTLFNNTNPVTAGGQADDKFIVAVSTDGETWTAANATVWSNEAGAAHVYDNIAAAGEHFELPLAAYYGQTIRVAFYGESTASNGDNDLHLSNIVISEPVACGRPVAVTVANIEQTSATVTINDPEGAAWEYVINSVDATPVAVNTTSFQLSNLAVHTNYTVYVRRVCGVGNVSAWRSVTFTTACGVMELPYVENFDSYAGVPSTSYSISSPIIPDCWTAQTSSSVVSVASSTTYAKSGTQTLIFYGSTDKIVALPTFNADNQQVLFNLSYRTESGSSISNGTFEVGYLAVPGDESSFVSLQPAPLTTTFTDVQVIIPAAAVVEPAIKYVAGSASNWYAAIDNIEVKLMPSCFEPTALTAVSLTSNTATISITDQPAANAWEYVLNDVNNTPIALNSNTFVIEDLEAQTDYVVYVRRVCSESETSEWVALPFRTACEEVALPYSENFDSYTGGIASSTTRPTSTPVYPDCWTFLNETGSSSAYPQAFLTSYNSYRVEGNALFVKMASGTPLLAVLPGFNTTAATPLSVSFSYRNEGVSSSNGHVQLGYVTSLADAESFVLVAEFPQITSMTAVEEDMTLPVDAQVAFRFVGGEYSNYYASIDNVLVEAASSCERPEAVSVSNITPVSVDVLITDPLSAHNAWEVVVVEKDADPFTGTPVLINSKAATIAGDFADGAMFDLYVRTVCGENEVSNFRGPVTFKYVDISSVSDVPAVGVGAYPWAMNTAGTRFESTNGGVDSSTSDMEATVVVPAGAMATFSFQYYVSSESASYDYLCMYVDEADPSESNYHEGFGVKGGNSPAANGTYSITFTPGTHKVLWRYRKDISYSYGEDKAQVWNMRVTYNMFYTPTGLGVLDLTGESATLYWSAGSDAVRNEVHLTSADTDTIISTIGNSLDLTGLSDTAVYRFVVRSFSAEGDSTAWSSAYTFKYIDYSVLNEELSFLGGPEYPWEVIDEGFLAKAQSTNAEVSESYSDLVATFVVPEGEKATLSFDYTVNAYLNMNCFVMYVDEANPSATNYDPAFGQQISTYEETDFRTIGNDEEYTYTFSPIDSTWTLKFNAGTHTVRWRYYNNFAGDSYTTEQYDYDEDWEIYYYNVTDIYDYGTFGRRAQVYNIRYESIAHWAPEDITLVAVGQDSAVVTWTQCEDAVKNEVSIAGQILETTSDTIVLTGLNSSSEYSLNVRSITATDTTAWSDVFSFWTECGIYSLPFAEDFNSLTSGIPYCWDNSVGTSSDSYKWNYYYNGNTGAGLRFDSYSNSSGNTNTLKTPEINVADVDAVLLSFAYKNPTGGSMRLIASRDGRDTTINAFPAGGVSDWTDYQFVIPVSGAQSLFVKYAATSNWGSGDAYLYLDDIRVTRIATADTVSDVTCAGADYEGHGFNIAASELHAGFCYFQRVTFAASDLEADSLRTLKLFVNMPSVVEYRDTICAHSHYTGYGFDIADVDPLRVAPYVKHLTNQFGCDSTVSLTLFIPQTEFAQTVHSCEGDTYTFGDSIITTSGVYVHTFQNQFGCDSTITLQIFFHGTSSAIEASICPGETYMFGRQPLTEAGTYYETFTNVAGCDSVVTLTLSILEPVVTYIDGIFCEGTTYAGGVHSPKFMDLSVPGVYTDTLKSAAGCDSILVLTLVEEHIQRTTVNGTYSEGKPFVYDGQSYQQEGTFEIIKTTVNGCDSIITLIVTQEGTALDNLELGNLAINPNPVHVGEEAVIRTDIAYTDDYVLRVYDAVGRLVAETTEQNGHVPALPVAGVYTVRVSAASQHFQTKLIVK